MSQRLPVSSKNRNILKPSNGQKNSDSQGLIDSSMKKLISNPFCLKLLMRDLVF